MSSIGNGLGGQRGLLAIAACGLVGLFPAGASGQGSDICGQTTRSLLEACQLEAADDRQVGFAVCLNLSNQPAARACKRETRETFADALQECDEVSEARDGVCEVIGRGPYDPVIDPANFVRGISNVYAPFQPGRWWEYRKQTEDGVERVRVEVLNRPREIQGVTVTTVRDRVWLDGELIEDTLDWVAQQRNGNVRYFGEIAKNFEDGLLANLDGSFEAGKNGAKSGIWVKAVPEFGEFYRQEWAPGDAEDVVEVVDLDAPDRVPFRGSEPVLKTRDFTPLSPDAVEFKFYVPGIGLVLEVDPESGERLRLVDFGPR